MRKVVVLLALLACLFVAPAAYAGPNVVVDGKVLVTDVPPVMVKERVYVPMRAVYESLGYIVTWNEALQMPTMFTPDYAYFLNFYVDRGTIYSSYQDRTVEMNPKPFYHNDRTMVPLRFVAEMLSCQVDWDDATQTAYINTAAQGTTTPNAQKTPKDIISENINSVVTILTDAGQGSGFFYLKNGIVVTNYHVIANARTIFIKTYSGQTYQTFVLGTAPEYDMAFIAPLEYQEIYPAATIGNSDLTQIGDQVIAIGSPQGFENTISTGIISGFRYSDSGVRLLQTTAPISQGSSGGPLFNENGEVIGLTYAIWMNGQNLNFAIPINYIAGLINKTLSNRR